MLAAIRHCSILIDFGPLIMRLMTVVERNEIHAAEAEGVEEFNKNYRHRAVCARS